MYCSFPHVTPFFLAAKIKKLVQRDFLMICIIDLESNQQPTRASLFSSCNPTQSVMLSSLCNSVASTEQFFNRAMKALAVKRVWDINRQQDPVIVNNHRLMTPPAFISGRLFVPVRCR
jgi:hypothetical protein